PVHSELFMVEIKTEADYALDINGQLEGEIGICIVEGSIKACEHHVEAGNMLVSKIDNQCAIEIKAGSHLLLFGGKPFEEERFIYWNFVASSKEKLEDAKQRWRNKQFPKVPGDDTYVPLPE
ncbi:MAG: pirin-like C-terminal cupin domain-containing protein, partial [Fulvivirga sp.]